MYVFAQHLKDDNTTKKGDNITKDILILLSSLKFPMAEAPRFVFTEFSNAKVRVEEITPESVRAFLKKQILVRVAYVNSVYGTRETALKMLQYCTADTPKIEDLIGLPLLMLQSGEVDILAKNSSYIGDALPVKILENKKYIFVDDAMTKHLKQKYHLGEITHKLRI